MTLLYDNSRGVKMKEKKSIYIFSHGNLKIRNYTLYLEKGNEVEKTLIDDVDEINILGEVKVNKDFLQQLADRGINAHFFNYYGYYSGTFYPKKHYDSTKVLLKQVEYYLDNHTRLNIARRLVEGAIENILQVLRYYSSRGKELANIQNSITELLKLSKECKKINELMAIEGNVRNYYYKSFDRILNNPDFKFEQRTRRPPKNYLNTLISFGNSMLYTTVLSQIYYTDLDPRIGYLHTSNFRRFSLNLDIAEIFKPIIVDRVIFNVINKNIITVKDFEYLSGGIMLKENGKEKFINQFEEK